jgi:flagellar biosynthesis anti-sigma factor FlgM
MRIDPQDPAIGSSGSRRVEDARAGQVKSSQQPASAEPNDTVHFSSGQATVRQLVSQLDQIPDVRQGQVGALRSAIGSGRYKPSDGQVAEALAAQTFGISESA